MTRFFATALNIAMSMQLLNKIISFLDIPVLYRLFFRLIGADVFRKIFATEYVMEQPSDKVPDIGCGPGDVLNYLPAVNYTGFDISEKYIDAAKCTPNATA
jgi:SAM-dependent methyltransferase